MSCGDFDGNHISKEAKKKDLFVPNYLRRWINLKKAFPINQFDETKQSNNFTSSETIKSCKPTTHGMAHMLELMGLELEGRHHSGIDDAKNLARIVINLLESGFEFTQSMVCVRK